MGQRRRVVVAVVVGLICLVGAVFLGVQIYIGQGLAEKVARLSDLEILRWKLQCYAADHGSYPLRLEDAVEDKEFLRSLDPDGLVYVAGGQPFSPTALLRLFYEREPRRYGFNVGWFDFRTDSDTFHEGNADAEARTSGGMVSPTRASQSSKDDHE